MFDIGFMEIMLVLIVALLVIGPERMPEVARSIGKTVAKVRRFIENTKRDIDMDSNGELAQLMNLRRELQGELEEVRAVGSDLKQDVSNWQSKLAEDLDEEELKNLGTSSYGGQGNTSASKAKDPYETFRQAGVNGVEDFPTLDMRPTPPESANPATTHASPATTATPLTPAPQTNNPQNSSTQSAATHSNDKTPAASASTPASVTNSHG